MSWFSILASRWRAPVLAIAGQFLILSVQAAEGPSLLTTRELLDDCRAWKDAGDADAGERCRWYVRGVYEAALAIQSRTRENGEFPGFTVLCYPEQKLTVDEIVDSLLDYAFKEPHRQRDSFEVEPTVFILRTINIPYACK